MLSESASTELVLANRILAAQGVVDSFGHVSVRAAGDADRFLLSCARAPDQVVEQDIMSFDLDGAAIDPQGRQPYLERFIHAAIYAARPDVQAVVHSHAYAVIPFGITGVQVRPVMHVCSSIGRCVPVWDIAGHFGDTDLLVSDLSIGRDLASALRNEPAILMRGHGATVVGRTLREAVHTAVYLQVNCTLQLHAAQLSAANEIRYLSDGEIAVRAAKDPTFGIDRAWESWRAQAEARERQSRST
jgi:HCOMODA/2-hydroxy-3-carboxy-muconic semialdehyde decarboxylase